jgi:hypothetical protein
MTVIPLRGRCANCGADELLSRIADGEGMCPFCHLPFCDEDRSLFVQQVFRAEIAYRLLIRSVGRLSAPPVRLHVLPEPLLEGLRVGLATTMHEMDDVDTKWPLPIRAAGLRNPCTG